MQGRPATRSTSRRVCGGDACETLEKIEGRALGGQKRGGPAGDDGEFRARGDRLAVARSDFEPDGRIDNREHPLRGRKPADRPSRSWPGMPASAVRSPMPSASVVTS